MDFAAHVGVGGAGAGIRARHFAVADGGEKHRDHGDEDGGDHVAACFVADHAVDAHGRDRLDDHDADDDQVPEGEGALEADGG